MKIGELLFDLGFNADTMKLKDFGKAIGDLNMSSILTAGSFGAVYEGAKALVGIADEMALGINKFGRETGQSTQEVQKWSKMAEQMGISAGVVQGSVATLEDSLFKMRFTGEGSNIWNMMGLDPTHTKNMFEVLTMLRERLKGMTTEQQRFFLQSLGISTEMLNMFKLTNEQWSEIAKQQTLSGKQLEEMNEYHKTMTEMGQNLKMIWADLGVSLVPIFKGFMEIANSIDKSILKSWEFKGILDTISEIMTKVAHPFKLFGEAAGALPKLLSAANSTADYSLYGGTPEERTRLALGPASTKTVSVSAPITIHSNDPDATGRAVQKHLDKTVDDAVNDRPAGSI